MNVLSKFEGFMASLVEGSFDRVFHSKLSMLELKSKLERHMEDNLFLKGQGQRVAHTYYEVTLSQKDYDALTAYRALSNEVQKYLIDVALERKYKLARKPVIKLKANPTMRAGKVQITSQLDPLANQPQPPGAIPGEGEADAPIHTVAINLADGFHQALQAQAGAAAPQGDQSYLTQPPPGAGYRQPYPPGRFDNVPYPAPTGRPGNQAVQGAPPAQAELWLRSRNGREWSPQEGPERVYRLQGEPLQIGRHASNDVRVDDRRASRYHAQIRYEQGRFFLYDLGSQNGTVVNGKAVRQPRELREGDKIAVGSFLYEFHYRR